MLYDVNKVTLPYKIKMTLLRRIRLHRIGKQHAKINDGYIYMFIIATFVVISIMHLLQMLMINV